jgi:hypothetical protein
MPVRLFHRTTLKAIPLIFAEGFRDGDDGVVWFSKNLDDWGSRGAQPIEVIADMTEEDLSGYAVRVVADEELDNESGEFVKVLDETEVERFTWYQIPAATINPIAEIRIVSNERVRNWPASLPSHRMSSNVKEFDSGDDLPRETKTLPDTECLGSADGRLTIDRDSVEATAYHEAGHAVVANLHGENIKWVAVHPLPDEFNNTIDGIKFGPGKLENLGLVKLHPDLDPNQNQKTWHERLQISLAGQLAEGSYTGQPITLDSSDFKSVAFFSSLSGESSTAQVAHDCKNLTRLLIDEHWPQIQAVAVALIKRKYLEGDEVRRIILEATP